MPEEVVRVGVVPRHAVTHELTEEGLRIVEDQVVTVEAGEETKVPLGEFVRADPVITDHEEPEATEAAAEAATVAEAGAPAPEPEPPARGGRLVRPAQLTPEPSPPEPPAEQTPDPEV